MKIIFVRHGEPNYKKDTLTEKGWREARLLAERISKWEVTQFYCSPLGRAKDTASCTLEKTGRTAITLDFMREFSYPIDDPVTKRHGVPWDFVPSFWSEDPLMLDMDKWVETDVMKQEPQIAVKYKEVWDDFDGLLAGYGYVREGHYYLRPDAKERFIPITSAPGNEGYPQIDAAESLPDDGKEPVIVIFCHLGITCLVLSHLLNIPFPVVVHGFFMPTTSLTILSSEERWGKEAYFRVQALGDVGHLIVGGEPVSIAGSFTEPFHQ